MNGEDDIYALSIGDAMAGMMLILIMAFLSVFLQMKAISNQRKDEAEKYFSIKKQIYNSLVNEFSGELEKKEWNARIDENTLSFILENSDNGFKQGSADIPGEFRLVLDQFVPRYIHIISKYQEHVSEIRIEGHTSSEWGSDDTECISNNESCKDTIYIKNMRLSQDRAMSVLNHILLMENIENRNWVRAKLTASGFSSSHVLCGQKKELCTSGSLMQENREASRRVEFSIRTDAETKIAEILNPDTNN